MLRLGVLAGLLFLAAQGTASAACSCECVNGQVQAICSSSIDLKPICGPRVCPLTPPSIAPIQSPGIPPLGTRSCGQAQVFDPASGRYVWQSLCR